MKMPSYSGRFTAGLPINLPDAFHIMDRASRGRLTRLEDLDIHAQSPEEQSQGRTSDAAADNQHLRIWVMVARLSRCNVLTRKMHVTQAGADGQRLIGNA